MTKIAPNVKDFMRTIFSVLRGYFFVIDRWHFVLRGVFLTYLE